jgi:sugar phosphate isomerase/epimerase
MLTRRDFGKMTLAALPLAATRAANAAKLNSVVGGVRLGVQTYSYRDLPMDGIIDSVIKAMTETGLAECELFAQQAEPPNIATNFWSGVDPKVLGAGADGGALTEQLRAKAKQEAVMKAREELRKWRLEVPLDHFRAIRKKFDAAGIDLHVYNLSFNASFTDPEMDRIFEHAKALGVNIISASTTETVAKRLVPFAEKHKMYVSMHGHANVTDPDEFSSPETFQRALALSKYFKINLDIGHFSAANFDAVAYIKEKHADITHLHIKDRKKNGGPNVEWGQGDTPIKEVLQTLKKNKYPIPAYIEYEYPGKGSGVDEVKKCFEYCKQALA